MNNVFFLGVLPYQDQWNYTVGARVRYFREKSYFTFVVSRNHLDNKIYKFSENRNAEPDQQIFDYRSSEVENKIRLEHTARIKGFKINYGLQYEFASYFNKTNRRTDLGGVEIEQRYKTELGIHKYAFFTQVDKRFVHEKLGLSIGIRMDGANFDKAMRNPLGQMSPRLSLSYTILPGLSINANTGIYYQQPSYTVLGFKDNEDRYVNKLNNVDYIRNIQTVGGVSYTTGFNAKFSIEGFYKRYHFYPLLKNDAISLANLGGDFGVIGAEEVTSESNGKAYGLELLFQQKLYKGFYGIATYTWYRSMFTNADGRLASSSWDFKHIVTLVGGKKFKRNWELGLKWTLYGGAPYTPYDIEYSLISDVWDVNNEGQLDYSLINTQRLKPVHRLDIRVDKKWFFTKWNLDLYLDISNLYNNKAAANDILTVVREDDGTPIEDPENPGSYLPLFIPNDNGQLIPTIGIVVSY